MPFKGPHQRPRPDVQREAPAKDGAGQRIGAVMHESRQLRHIDRLIRNEAVRKRQLDGGPVGIAPFGFVDQGQHLAQLVAADAGGRSRPVDQMCLALVIAAKADVDVKRAFHHEIAAFQLDHRGAAAGRFRVAAVRLAIADAFGRIIKDRALVAGQEPADRHRARVRPLFRAVETEVDLHERPQNVFPDSTTRPRPLSIAPEGAGGA